MEVRNIYDSVSDFEADTLRKISIDDLKRSDPENRIKIREETDEVKH